MDGTIVAMACRGTRSEQLAFVMCGCNCCVLSRALDRIMTTGDELPIDEIIQIAVDVISTNEFLARSSRHELIIKILQFGRFVRNQGLLTVSQVDQQLVETWIYQPTVRGGFVSKPKSSTLRNRRSAVRALFRALRTVGYEVGDPTIDSEALLDRTFRTVVCTDVQIERLRLSVPVGLVHSTLAAVLAMAEAGATNSEIARITGSEIDADCLALPGNARVAPRRNKLTEWGSSVLAARVSELRSSDDLLAATMPVRTLSNGAVSNQLRTICQFANLSHHGITVNSIRAWRAQRIVVETGSLEMAARFLGARSLDAVASLIGYNWGPHS